MVKCQITLCVVLGASALEVPAAGIEAGTLFWQADNGQNQSLLWGPEVRLMPQNGERPVGLRASFVQATFNQGGDRERVREFLACAGWVNRWGTLSGGWTFHDIRTELQRNAAWSYPLEEQERNADLHGPYLAYEVQWPPERSWRAALTAGWMPYDAGDLPDLDYDGSFYDLAGGIQWLASRVRTEAGYRYRAYRDLPDRVMDDRTYNRSTQEGWYLSLLFRF